MPEHRDTVIWTNEIDVVMGAILEMPVGATIVHVDKPKDGRPERIAIWYSFEALPGATIEKEYRTFSVFGTGHVNFGEYVGTAVYHGHGLVWHLYEVTNV